MSYIVRCDACGKRALCAYVDGSWVEPTAWRSVEIDRRGAHTCGEACREALLAPATETGGAT